MGILSGPLDLTRGLGLGDGFSSTEIKTGSLVDGPPPGDCAITLIDKLGMRANAITKSFFMFVFMIVLILRLTPKFRKQMAHEQLAGHFLTNKLSCMKYLKLDRVH